MGYNEICIFKWEKELLNHKWQIHYEVVCFSFQSYKFHITLMSMLQSFYHKFQKSHFFIIHFKQRHSILISTIKQFCSHISSKYILQFVKINVTHWVVNKIENEFTLNFAVTAILYLKGVRCMGLETAKAMNGPQFQTSCTLSEKILA